MKFKVSGKLFGAFCKINTKMITFLLGKMDNQVADFVATYCKKVMSSSLIIRN